ncbi:trypsin-1-like isoform X2 [Diachasmimorpha longicaudata]|uniref:trypsin-1-like isoform X2 n=1 Tax=Diachasmimorpha longicaudata TaxID=58733 RepID=UPI0030B8CF05
MKMLFGKLYTISVIFICFIFYNVITDVNGDRVQRMISADDATAEEFPSNAFITSEYILRDQDKIIAVTCICGGSLVTLFHVLTAAHCAVYQNEPQNSVYYRVPNRILVKLGMNSTEEGGYQYSVKRIYRHPNYKPIFMQNRWATYDIAIFELEKPAELGPTQQIIKLPCYQPDLGEKGIVVASGRTAPDYSGAVKLAKGVFTVVKCDNWVVFGVICIWSEDVKLIRLRFFVSDLP